MRLRALTVLVKGREIGLGLSLLSLLFLVTYQCVCSVRLHACVWSIPRLTHILTYSAYLSHTHTHTRTLTHTHRTNPIKKYKQDVL